MRDHQVLSRVFSNVELCCELVLVAGSLPALRGAPAAHTQHQHRVALRRGGRTQRESSVASFRVGKNRMSWKPLELHVEAHIRGRGVSFFR